MTRIAAPTPEILTQAAQMIRDGALVAFPTETVYGLGADATNGEAVARIFDVKGRPSFNPLISHGSSLAMLREEADFDERALALADKFWPGPLTMILPRAASGRVSDLTCAGLKTIALRIPDHPVALSLIEEAGVPIAAPSANKSGGLSPTTPHHVEESLGQSVPLILAGGPSQFGLESTVIDLTGKDTVICRAGAITAEEIAETIDAPVTYQLQPTDKPRSPGQLLKHYAPNTKLRLRAIDVEQGEALLAFGSTKFMGIKGGGKVSDLPQDHVLNLSESGDLFEAAANLFTYLHKLDALGVKSIAVMDIPDISIGIAINDRLKRAAEN